MKIITKFLPLNAAQEITALWTEYVADTTKEARLVKDIDKFEWALQGFNYENGTPTKYHELNLRYFCRSREKC
jgi:5'-deoxynucleotidase YfbR-like HD superfamily hydrolase